MSSDHISETLSDLQSTLEQVSDRIGDLSTSLLRDAIEAGEGRPAMDKTLSRVRRAVDKASLLLVDLEREHREENG